MEHEVVVPLPAAVVQQSLRDPELLVRCVPGLSLDADGESPAGEELHGRLRLRIAGSTITYRGVLSLIEGREGVLTVLAEGQEARGSGAATATVRITVIDNTDSADDTESADEGSEEDVESTTVRFGGDLSATGRLTDFDADVLTAAGRRLLDRFAAALAAEAGDAEPPTATVVYLEDHAAADFGADLDDDLSDLIAFSDSDAFSSAEVPESPADLSYEYQPDPLTADSLLGGPVRRSIVGRSAEEVDHAPPRGRYAPALPARSARARAATRWGGAEAVPVDGSAGERSAMPWVIGGGVALLGGAVVLVRALRRR
ncbi:SRPBCC domain-containing protein [Kitasatospora atroaurantiaca]|uniref:Carbon monoxide dehydrogenase subunit G n=1 Tax=Kitasatospora atroaurantiaca TaxID=285545 RepID=A0A561ESB9_9ACTN|nr:hypothetical protein [Kitasatospora atroaurantiaca]TWE18507.1 carbon monoxide dehydrogenase subunit G [Kitasatospora atroaurantiaca]